ncbi:hypothetical protein E4P40_10480 [Blastococcus sp. CT_GayMR20]|uniref:hypothetical protein n=1 Tax=Blastococcus sp. CT_GayMR20 TaxID=2559609 RepID=UPI001072EDC0|nr:hypothetical protein [Blastococcus sp. CT_GayMR20]TFV88124.1 hypothetical protein E4P40_10480 [Blastococcus sp. CT_GayMR20]
MLIQLRRRAHDAQLANLVRALADSDLPRWPEPPDRPGFGLLTVADAVQMDGPRQQRGSLSLLIALDGVAARGRVSSVAAKRPPAGHTIPRAPPSPRAAACR